MDDNDMSDRETRVRERAHQLWEREGQPEGRDEEFWRRAEQEIDGDPPTSVPPTRTNMPNTPHVGTGQPPPVPSDPTKRS